MMQLLRRARPHPAPAFYLPLKHVPSIYHVVLLRNPEHTPGIRNHALALVAALDWTEYEGLAGGVFYKLILTRHLSIFEQICYKM